jgi:hypothetical protein
VQQWQLRRQRTRSTYAVLTCLGSAATLPRTAWANLSLVAQPLGEAAKQARAILYQGQRQVQRRDLRVAVALARVRRSADDLHITTTAWQAPGIECGMSAVNAWRGCLGRRCSGSCKNGQERGDSPPSWLR